MYITMTTEELLYSKAKPMDVLWGAWAKQVKLNERQGSIDIIGIYDTIHKEKKGDFPLVVDLQAILTYQANRAEFEETYQITFDFIDMYGVNKLFSLTRRMTVPSGDIPLRWYESYRFDNIEIREPDYYELLVSVDRQFKQRIPLWVIAPKMIILDLEKDSTTELWPEDWLPKD